MTDPLVTPPPLPPTRRGIKIALAISVALNLAVVGLVGGIVLHDGPDGRRGMMARDLGFGPYDQILSDQDRGKLQQTILQRMGDLRTARRQMQADGAAILQALRADPYDATALGTALDTQVQNLSNRLKLGGEVMRDYLLALPEAERREFADRLERQLRRGRDGKGPEKAD